jgi:hypothetical protein
MDAQDLVLERHPDAEAIEEPPILRHGDYVPVERGYWAIFAEAGTVPLGDGATEEAAWKDAARKLGEGRPTRWLCGGIRSHRGHPLFARSLHLLR